MQRVQGLHEVGQGNLELGKVRMSRIGGGDRSRQTIHLLERTQMSGKYAPSKLSCLCSVEAKRQSVDRSGAVLVRVCILMIQTFSCE